MKQPILKQNNTTSSRPNLEQKTLLKTIKKIHKKNDVAQKGKQAKVMKKLSQEQQLKKHLFKQNINLNDKQNEQTRKSVKTPISDKKTLDKNPRKQKQNMTDSKIVQKNQRNCPETSQQKINKCIENMQKNCQKIEKCQNDQICLGGTGKKLGSQKNRQKSQKCLQTNKSRQVAQKKGKQNNSQAKNQSLNQATCEEKVKCQNEKGCVDGIDKKLSPKNKLSNSKCEDKKVPQQQKDKKVTRIARPTERSMKQLSKQHKQKISQNKKSQQKIIKNNSRVRLQDKKQQQKVKCQKKQNQSAEQQKQKINQVFNQFQQFGKDQCQKKIICEDLNGEKCQTKQLQVIPEEQLKKTLDQSEFNKLTNLSKSQEKNLIVKRKEHQMDLLVKGNALNIPKQNLVENKSAVRLGQRSNRIERKSDKKSEGKLNNISLRESNVKKIQNQKKQDLRENKSSITQMKKSQVNSAKQAQGKIVRNSKQIQHKRTEAKHPLNENKQN